MAFKCIIFNFRLWLMSIFLVTTANAALRFNVYNKNYIEDSCLSNESFEYVLEDTGLASALKIGATSYSWFSSNRNCTIEIYPPDGYGVVLRVDSMYFGNKMSSQCSDYIQVYGDQENSTKLCGFLPESLMFLTQNEMKLRYYTSPQHVLIPGFGFTLLATSYKKEYGFCADNQFTCATGECIWKGFTCDGVENCPDGSDEKAFCADIGSFTMRPLDWDWNIIYPTSSIATYRKSFNVTISAAIAAAVLILVIGLIRFFCHYHCAQARRRDVIRGITIIRARSMPPQNSRAPPPPYTSLVNEAAVTSMPTNPPDYLSVVQDATAGNAGVHSTSNDKNQTTQNNSAATEPPPPYEP